MLITAVLTRKAVDEREMEFYRRIEIIEKFAPAVKYRGFVLIRAELIIYLRESDRLGVNMVTHAADTVREHPLKGYAVLRGAAAFILPPGVGDRSVNLSFFFPCELSCNRESILPPC